MMDKYKSFFLNSYVKTNTSPPSLHVQTNKLTIGSSNNLPTVIRWLVCFLLLSAFVTSISQAIVKQIPISLVFTTPLLLFMYFISVVELQLEVDVNKSQIELFQNFIFFRLSIHKQYFNEQDSLYVHTSHQKYVRNGKWRKGKCYHFSIGDKSSKESVLLTSITYGKTTKSGIEKIEKQVQDMSVKIAKVLSTDIYYIDTEGVIEHIELESLE